LFLYASVHFKSCVLFNMLVSMHSCYGMLKLVSVYDQTHTINLVHNKCTVHRM